MCDIGVYGLAVMGQNFALNMASHGFKVAVCNRSTDKVSFSVYYELTILGVSYQVDTTVSRAVSEGNLPLLGFKDVPSFVAGLAVPRKVVILVQAGAPVDDTIALLAEHMQV